MTKKDKEKAVSKTQKKPVVDAELKEKLKKLTLKPQTKAAIFLESNLPEIGVVSSDTNEAETFKLDKLEIVEHLMQQSVKLANKDTSDVQQTLFSQIAVLDQVFYHYLTAAVKAEYPEAQKTLMNIALKAQSQCRSSSEALSEIMNPKPYFQQNNTAYNQQINNASSCVEKNNPKTTNELLEDKGDEQWLDTGTPQETGENDSIVETVGNVHGTED